MSQLLVVEIAPNILRVPHTASEVIPRSKGSVDRFDAEVEQADSGGLRLQRHVAPRFVAMTPLAQAPEVSFGIGSPVNEGDIVIGLPFVGRPELSLTRFALPASALEDPELYPRRDRRVVRRADPRRD